jgi:hypothetical protein
MFKPNHHPTTETESKEMLFDSYVTIIHKHICTTCNMVEVFSQCFEVWLHPTKTRSSNLRDLRPVVGTHLKPMNMAQINAAERRIPICHRCVASYRVVGRPEIVTVKASNEQWQETLRNKYAPPPKAEVKVARASAAAVTPKAVPSLDQI